MSRKLIHGSTAELDSLALLVGTARLDHATQFKFTGEFAAEVGQVLHQLFDHLDECLLGGDRAIRLDTNEHLRNIRMRDLVARHEDVLVHLQVLGQEVTEGVVLLLDYEVGSVGHAGKNLLLNLLLAIGEQEELEAIRGVHLGELECGIVRSSEW